MDTMMGIMHQVIPRDNFLTLVGVFVAYSFIGWVVESIYMSWCNKKVTNRGFAKGPLCPIYGVGEFIIYTLFSPFAHNLFAVFIVTAVMATIVEYIVAKLMIHKLGYVWWDYTNKPFNYKGILCLESTIGWGLYGICEFTFLREAIIKFWSLIPTIFLIVIFVAIGAVYLLDSGTQLHKVLSGNIEASENNLLKVER